MRTARSCVRRALQLLAAPTIPYLFTGQRYDSETGFYYFRNRYYDPELGRFISRDPLGYVDGMSLYAGYFAPHGLDPLGLRGPWRRARTQTPTPVVPPRPGPRPYHPDVHVPDVPRFTDAMEYAYDTTRYAAHEEYSLMPAYASRQVAKVDAYKEFHRLTGTANPDLVAGTGNTLSKITGIRNGDPIEWSPAEQRAADLESWSIAQEKKEQRGLEAAVAFARQMAGVNEGLAEMVRKMREEKEEFWQKMLEDSGSAFAGNGGICPPNTTNVAAPSDDEDDPFRGWVFNPNLKWEDLKSQKAWGHTWIYHGQRLLEPRLRSQARSTKEKVVSQWDNDAVAAEYILRILASGSRQKDHRLPPHVTGRIFISDAHGNVQVIPVNSVRIIPRRSTGGLKSAFGVYLDPPPPPTPGL
jgi:RHS repeat-associated protein